MRAASPVPVTAGSPRSQQLRGGFLRRMPEKTAESNSRWALPPRAPPLLCGCFLVRNTPRGRSFVRRTPEKTAESNSRWALPPRAPPLLCGCFLVRNTPRGRSFVRRIAPEKPHNLIRGGPCPLEHPRCFIVACMEWEAQQKKRPPQSRGSGAGTVCLIRRETAAGTRAGCSSPPRTAKRHRRERACPCRSR